MSPTTTEISPSQGAAIQGTVHGGQSPIVGARIYMFAAGTGGYGGQSTSLLTSTGGNTTLDQSGGPTNGYYYVTSGAGGAFSITGDYSCSENTQVYLYAVGGNPGLPNPNANNNAAGLLAVLGNCPGGTNAFLGTISFITINEVSTVAAAYSFAGFATDATHVSSPNNNLARSGVMNAFANAANLADLGSGNALSAPPNNTYVVSPQATVYTLANILASCVNSDGTISSGPPATACYNVLNNAKSGSGTVPTDTATAAINIAHNPGANVHNLYQLASGAPPFGSALVSEPNDFTVALQLTAQDMSEPNALAIDASGNVWVANIGISTIDEFSNSGAVLSGTTGFSGGGLNLADGIAIDLSGNAWATNFSQNSVSEFSPTGSPISPTGTGFTGSGGLSGPYGIAVDGNDRIWVTSYTGNSITQLDSGGNQLANYNTGSPAHLNLSSPRGIAIDANENVWVASKANSAVAEISNTGTVIVAGTANAFGVNKPYSIAIDGLGDAWIPNYGTTTATSTITELSSLYSPIHSSPFSEGGAYEPEAVAIDGAGNAWIADNLNASVSEFSPTGTLVSPSTGYWASATLSAPVGVAIDGSGNVWIADSFGTLTEMIGAATPVVTPLAAGVKNGTLGAKP